MRRTIDTEDSIEQEGAFPLAGLSIQCMKGDTKYGTNKSS